MKYPTSTSISWLTMFSSSARVIVLSQTQRKAKTINTPTDLIVFILFTFPPSKKKEGFTSGSPSSYFFFAKRQLSNAKKLEPIAAMKQLRITETVGCCVTMQPRNTPATIVATKRAPFFKFHSHFFFVVIISPYPSVM
jgi:hypothetical protein